MGRENERRALQEVVPIQTPFVVHIETNNTCNFKHKCCFESNDKILKDNGIERGFMKPEVFRKIIDDLMDFPDQIKRLYFHVILKWTCRKKCDIFCNGGRQ